jgi:hypothetical protein
MMDVRNTFHAELVADLDLAATDLGYDLVLSTLTPARDERRAAEILLDFRCEALILLGPQEATGRLNALGAHLPVVVIGRRIPAAAVDVVRPPMTRAWLAPTGLGDPAYSRRHDGRGLAHRRAYPHGRPTAAPTYANPTAAARRRRPAPSAPGATT